jgi:hypothetical protein
MAHCSLRSLARKLVSPRVKGAGRPFEIPAFKPEAALKSPRSSPKRFEIPAFKPEAALKSPRSARRPIDISAISSTPV